MAIHSGESSKYPRILRHIVAYVKRHNFLMPAVMAFSLFIVVVLLAISIWFSNSVSSHLEDAVYEVVKQQASMGSETLRLTLDGFGSLSGWISELEQVSPRAYRASSYRAFQAFKDYDLPVFRFSNLILYYGQDVMTLSVRGTSWPQVRFPYVQDFDGFLECLDNISSKQLLCTADFGADYAHNTLIMAHPLPNHALALFTLEYEDLRKLIMSGASSMYDASLRLLVDSSGHVLWSNAVISQEDVLSVLQQKQNDSKKVLQLDGKDYLFSNTSITGNLSLVTLDEVTTQFDAMNHSIRMLAALCILLLIIGVALLILGLQRSGAPIVQLVSTVRQSMPGQDTEPDNTVDVLKLVCSQYSQLVREVSQQNALLSNDELYDLFVLRIICGQYTDPNELQNLIRWLNVDFPYSSFAACLIFFEQPPSDAERRNIETLLRRFSGDGFSCCVCLNPDRRSAVGMINLDETCDLRAFGEKLLDHLLEKTSVTIGLGDIYDSMDSLGHSYLEAHTALEQRLIHGKNTCILYSDMPLAAESSAAYPKQQLESFVLSLQRWEPVSIQKELEQIIAFIHQNALSLQQVKCICFELSASLLREINRMGSLPASVNNSMLDVFSIAEYTSINELADKIVQLSQVVQQYIDNRRSHRKDDLISRCKQCIQQNIANQQFSLGLLAEQFDITPQTLRRNFKEATGQTLSSYLIQLRIERAKQLLIQTDLDLNNICVQCGYIDVSSFTRLFKNEVGVSPGIYRENHRK